MNDAEPTDREPEDGPTPLTPERSRASGWSRGIEDRIRPRLASIAKHHPALWRRLVAPSLTVAARVSGDAVGIQAGSLTYGAFLSLPPLLVIMMSIAGALLQSHPDAAQNLVTTVTNVVPGLDQVIDANVQLKGVQQLGIGLAGVVAVIWAASGFAARTRHAFGTVFRTERTGLVAGRISGALLGTPIILLFFALAVAGNVSAGIHIGGLPWVTEVVGLATVAIVSLLFVLLTYRLLTPGRGPTLRDHVPGAVVFALGWTALHLLGATYVSYVIAKTTALYGAVGTIFGVLAFLYLTMWLLLLGAEVSEAFRSTAAGVAAVVDLPPDADAR